MGWEVNAVSGGGDCYVGAGVEQEGSSQFSVLSSHPKKNAHGFASQRFQIAGGEIFFAELDVVDAFAGGFGDFVQEANAPSWLIAGECGVVGDVVQEHAISFLLSVISLRQGMRVSQ